MLSYSLNRHTRSKQEKKSNYTIELYTYVKSSRFQTYLMIDIAVIHICVPGIIVAIDVLTKKHFRLFLTPSKNEITEENRIPCPMACCRAAKSKSFLIIWFIFSHT